jgi:hypothetical protein
MRKKLANVCIAALGLVTPFERADNFISLLAVIAIIVITITKFLAG